MTYVLMHMNVIVNEQAEMWCVAYDTCAALVLLYTEISEILIKSQQFAAIIDRTLSLRARPT